MPGVELNVQGKPTLAPTLVRVFYCLVCGVLYMLVPPDRICLSCKSQGKLNQVDIEVAKATETALL